MRKPTPVEEEIHAIRLAFYEKTKGMTPSEINAYIREQTAPTEREFGFRPVASPPPRETEKAF